MPIEIKELHIRVTVNNPNTTAPATQPAAQSANAGGDGGGKDEIIAECVEQVLHILKEKSER